MNDPNVWRIRRPEPTETPSRVPEAEPCTSPLTRPFSLKVFESPFKVSNN